MEAEGARMKIRSRSSSQDLGFCFPKSIRSSRGKGDASRKSISSNTGEACIFELLATVAGQLLQEQTSGSDLRATNRTAQCDTERCYEGSSNRNSNRLSAIGFGQEKSATMQAEVEKSAGDLEMTPSDSDHSVGMKRNFVDKTEADGGNENCQLHLQCDVIHGAIVDETPELVSTSNSEGTPSSILHLSPTAESQILNPMSMPIVKISSTNVAKSEANKMLNRAIISKRKHHNFKGEEAYIRHFTAKRIHLQKNCAKPLTSESFPMQNNLSPLVAVKAAEGSCPGSPSSSNCPKSGESHVKLKIQSFTIPQLFVEIPESATIANLKKAVMEAAMNQLGGGLCVHVLLEGRRLMNESATLLEAGIATSDDQNTLSFMLEPSNLISKSASNEDSILVLTHAADQFRYPNSLKGNMVGPRNGHDSTFGGQKSSNPNCSGNCSSPADALQELALVPLCQKSDAAVGVSKRRVRRPFNIDEVEALVQAVEKLGTGRWRDVKLHAFAQSKHRTYVDLKDKWKTLVHTASIASHQRRGEPVPQALLDRVILAHTYWTAKTTGQTPSLCKNVIVHCG